MVSETTDLDHPRHDALVAYVDGRVDAADREWIDAHLEVCAICTEDVADLREMAQLIPGSAAAAIPEPRRRVTLVIAAYIAAALMLTTWVVFRDAGREGGVVNTPDATAANIPSPTPSEAPVLPPLPAGPVEPRRLQLQLPAYHDALRPQAGVLLRENVASSSFVVLGPVGTAVESPRPTFRWTPLEGASSYRVTVVDDSFTEVAAASGITTTTWTPDRDLPRNTVLTWQVRAERADGSSVVTPAPPLPEARVFVLSARNVQLLTTERQALANAPADLGLLLARLGLYDEAIASLERARTDDTYRRADIERALTRLRR